MLLNEFFGNPIKAGKKTDKQEEDQGHMADELFWFILDHDKLHKDYFHKNAKKLKGNHEKEELMKEFVSMTNHGCKELYNKHKMTGPLGKIFSKEMREDISNRLYDHHLENVRAGHYKIGG